MSVLFGVVVALTLLALFAWPAWAAYQDLRSTRRYPTLRRQAVEGRRCFLCDAPATWVDDAMRPPRAGCRDHFHEVYAALDPARLRAGAATVRDALREDAVLDPAVARFAAGLDAVLGGRPVPPEACPRWPPSPADEVPTRPDVPNPRRRS